MPTAYLPPSRLRELVDVSSAVPESAQDGNPLVWNNTSGFWQAGTVPRVNGLRFPVSKVANADPNTFDDYEEGIFTPGLMDFGINEFGNPDVSDLETSGYDYAGVQSGFYIKAGGFCTYIAFIGVNAKPNRDSDRWVVATVPFFGKANVVQIIPNSVSAYNSTWSIGSSLPLAGSSFFPQALGLYKSVSFTTGTVFLTLADISVAPTPQRINIGVTYLTN
jgi:hypothetical protein